MKVTLAIIIIIIIIYEHFVTKTNINMQHENKINT